MVSSPLLLDGEFIAYYPALAKQLGGQPLRAIIVQALWFRRDRSTDETRMSYEDIGEMVGTSGRTVERQVKWLIENGYISRRRASAVDATSVFGVIVSALTSDDASTRPTKTASRTTGSRVSNLPIGGIEDDKVSTSVPEPVPIHRNGALDHDNMSRSDGDNLSGSTTSKNLKKSSSSNDGFRDFWIAYPEMGFKGKKDACQRLWLALDIEERRDVYRSLMLWKNSIQWVEHPDRIPSPWMWLDGETWRGDKPKQVPPPIKMLTADDIRLPD